RDWGDYPVWILRSVHIPVKGNQMSNKRQVLPAHLYDELLEIVLERFGEERPTGSTENKRFMTAMSSVIQTSQGMHLITSPEVEDGKMNFDLWVEYPVDDVWEADELAYEVFSQVAEDIFVSTRQVEDKGVRYRFVTGTMENGHQGSLHFTGPHAKEFADIYRMRITQGHRYHA